MAFVASKKKVAILKKTKNAFEKLNIQKTKEIENIEFGVIEKAMSIRDAIFGEYEEIDTENALNRICASPSVSCPPAIPIAVSVERITENHIALFKKYGIDKILVVK